MTRGTRTLVTLTVCAAAIPTASGAFEALLRDAVNGQRTAATADALFTLAGLSAGLAAVALGTVVATELWQRQSFTWNTSAPTAGLGVSGRALTTVAGIGACILWLAAGRPASATVAIGWVIGLSGVAIALGRVDLEFRRDARSPGSDTESDRKRPTRRDHSLP